MKFITWIKAAFEGSNQTASHRRLIAVLIMAACYVPSRARYYWMVKDPYWLILGSILDAAFVLLLTGIITAQDIVKFKTGKRDETNQ